MSKEQEKYECKKDFKKEVFGVLIVTTLLVGCISFILYLAKQGV